MAVNRILIVEDDPSIADTIALNLRYVGYDCSVFDNGSQAAASLEKDHAYDLALLDIMLPGMDGFELFSHMQNDGSFYSIPVIDPRQKVVGFYEGIEAFNDEKYFVIRNSNGLEKPVIYEYEGGGWSGVAAGSLATMYYDVFAYMQTSGVWGALPLQLIEDESVAPKQAHGRLSCTPAEARAMAEDLLAGTGMGVYRIYLICDYDPHFLAQETRTLETCNYGYTLECLRMVKGVPCASDSGVSDGVLDDYYSPSWPYEKLTIFINDDGIQSVQWSSPIEVTDILVENSNLMPFRDVMDIFKKMGSIVFTPMK